MEIRHFGGLDLRQDPQDKGATALDLLDVNVDHPDRIRSRGGWTKFNTGTQTGAPRAMCPFFIGATPYLVTTYGSTLASLDSTGAIVASQAAATSDFGLTRWSMVSFGSPSQESVYCIPSTTRGGTGTFTHAFRCDGVSFTDLGGAGQIPKGRAAAVQYPDNRLVVAQATLNSDSQVSFSGAGTPEAFAVNDNVQLSPGDGEYVSCLVSFRDYLFAFKQSKFFVFYGNSTTVTGQPIFNYRAVSTKIGAAGENLAVAGPDAVYFLARNGVYRTFGVGAPELISAPLDPLFGNGDLPTSYGGSAINWSAINGAYASFYDRKLYLSVPTGSSTTNDRMLVFDTATDTWTVWSVPAGPMAVFRRGSVDELYFGSQASSWTIGEFTNGLTTDNGTGISARYRTGFFDIQGARPDGRGHLRGFSVDASGPVATKIAVDDSATLGSSRALFPAGTYPTVARGFDRRGVFGRNVSLEFSGTAPWTVSRLQMPA